MVVLEELDEVRVLGLVLRVLHAQLDPVLYLLVVGLQVLQVGVDQLHYPLVGDRVEEGLPDLGEEPLVRRLLGLQLLLDLRVDANLVVEEDEETHVKLQFWKDLRSVSEEVVALHVQKHGNVPLVSHGLIDLFNLQVNVDLLVLLLELDVEIVFFALLGRLLLVPLEVVGNVGVDAGLRDHLVFAHVALVARE